MSLRPSSAVREFHHVFGHPVSENPSVPEYALQRLREDLLEEEFEEYMQASHREDLVGIADALADMIYIIHGTALVYGIPLDEIFDEVHRSNMSKLDENGRVVRRNDGKILKGTNYEPPQIAEIIQATHPEKLTQLGLF